MAKQKGIDFLANIDGSTFLYAKSFDFSLQSNLVETTNLTDGEYTSYLPVGGKGINGNVDAYVVPTTDASKCAKTVISLWNNNTLFNVQFTNTAIGTISASCYITEPKVSNPGSKDLLGFSFGFQSSGPLSIS